MTQKEPYRVVYSCGCTAGGDCVAAHCPICGNPISEEYGEARVIQAAESRVKALEEQLAEVTRERDHWKANHDEMVQRNHLLRSRPDVDDEVIARRVGILDRIDALKAEVERLRRELGECDTPITEDWLRSVGFQDDDEEPYLWINSGWQENPEFDLERWTDGDWLISDGDNTLKLVPPKTRGQLAMLCRALGIPLKPAASEGGEW